MCLHVKWDFCQNTQTILAGFPALLHQHLIRVSVRIEFGSTGNEFTALTIYNASLLPAVGDIYLCIIQHFSHSVIHFIFVHKCSNIEAYV